MKTWYRNLTAAAFAASAPVGDALPDGAGSNRGGRRNDVREPERTQASQHHHHDRAGRGGRRLHAARCGARRRGARRGRRRRCARSHRTPGGGARGGRAQVYASLPSFCRVAATLAPSSDSDIKVEVWLPASGWNGKFQAVGNGGWAGTISYPALAQAVAAGYATASTDTGHTGNSGAFALGHPEKLVDFGYRAVHEMTVQAKAIVDAFYGTAPTVVVLERVLAWRTAGHHRGAALPRRLRRDCRRRAGRQLDASAQRADGDESAGPRDDGELHPA